MAVVVPATAPRATDGDTRVTDFLDDKLQTFADFETLDSLLDRVRTQQALLRQQLDEAEADHRSAQDASETHQANIQRQHQEFQKQQADIDRRLMVVTRSDTTDDAVRRFEPSMDKLRKLQVANGYIEMLHNVEQLSHDADEQLKYSPDVALQSYASLRSLFSSLQSLQDAAEGAAPHLVDHVEKKMLQLQTRIKEVLSKNFEDLLAKLLWPKVGVAVPEAMMQEWSGVIGRLLELQKPALEAELSSSAAPKAPSTLFPFEIMTRPLEQRFQYHFEGNRPTNKLDKPEYFLSHVKDLVNQYSAFVNDFLQPELLKHFNQTNLADRPAYIDSTSALITAFLPMLRRRIFSLLPQVSKQPQLLSHFLHELMSFDATLRDEWQFAPIADTKWKGLTNEVLVIDPWFDIWLGVERDFAMARYESIVDTADSGDLDYETVAPSSTKPTKAAIRVNDLLETITDRYRPLSSFSQKLRFLIDIQISIFDRFHQRLHSGLEAFRTKTSSIGRTMQGVSPAELASLQGTQGLDRICRIYGSADYLEKAMRDWSDDVFFLDLWTELQTRARRHDNGLAPSTIAGSLSVRDVTARTSSSLTAAPDANDADTGALFDETAAAYRRLRVRSEGLLVERLTTDLRDAVRPYYHMNPWATLSAPSGTVDTPSPDLTATLSQLNASLGFLRKALAPLPLRRVARELAAALDARLWDRVLMGHTFSAAGAAQLAVDVAALEDVFERLAGTGQGRAGLRRVREGVVLLGLSVTEAPVEDDEEEEDAWQGNGEGDEQGEKSLGLWEVERRVFRDNESARDVLEQLGLEMLSEADARQVLGRRVELVR